MPKINRKFAGEWRVVELPEMMDEYLDEGESKPCIRLKAGYEDTIGGEYEIGLSTGGLDGAVRSFGEETIVVFGLRAAMRWIRQAAVDGCACAWTGNWKASSSTGWGHL
jgi:hypothetical protein